MKFVRFDGGKTGLVVAPNGAPSVIDVVASLDGLRRRDAAAADAIASALAPQRSASWVAMIAAWDEVRAAFATVEQMGGSAGCIERPFADCMIEAPVADLASKIFAIGSNTAVHLMRAMKAMAGIDLTEAEATQAKRDGLPPFGFMVWPSTVVGPDAVVAPPRGTRKFDYEGECVVYLQSAGRYQSRPRIWGYSAFNDFGVRDTHLKLAPEAPAGPFSFNAQKNFDSGKACGPWVVVDEGAPLTTLRCRVTVNGRQRQDWPLAEMIYGFEETLTYLSQGLTLLPGDMLASGTGAGVAIEGGVDGPDWLRPGDLIEVRLGDIAPLRNTIGAW